MKVQPPTQEVSPTQEPTQHPCPNNVVREYFELDGPNNNDSSSSKYFDSISMPDQENGWYKLDSYSDFETESSTSTISNRTEFMTALLTLGKPSFQLEQMKRNLSVPKVLQGTSIQNLCDRETASFPSKQFSVKKWIQFPVTAVVGILLILVATLLFVFTPSSISYSFDSSPNETITSSDSMSSAVNGSSLFVPAYFYPGPLWDKVIHSKPAFVVMNPDNGPGAQPDPNFVKTVAQAQEAGIKILGYIATGYGLENTSKVTEAIFQYDSWYKTDGIFLDQVSSKAEQLEYYQTVADYIRRSNSSSLVAINPGTYPEDMGYMALADMILAFEGSFESYTKIKVPLWTHNFNSSKFVHVVYEVEEIALAHSKVLAAERNAKYAFFTDLKRRDAYTLLPSYFN